VGEAGARSTPHSHGRTDGRYAPEAHTPSSSSRTPARPSAARSVGAGASRRGRRGRCGCLGGGLGEGVGGRGGDGG